MRVVSTVVTMYTNNTVKGDGVAVDRGTYAVVGSYKFAVSATAVQHLQQMRLPNWVAPALGGAEIVAAILFVLSRPACVGGYSLLLIFAIAALLHILHGEFQIGPLLVYAAAVLVCLSAGGPVAGALRD